MIGRSPFHMLKGMRLPFAPDAGRILRRDPPPFFSSFCVAGQIGGALFDFFGCRLLCETFFFLGITYLGAAPQVPFFSFPPRERTLFPHFHCRLKKILAFAIQRHLPLHCPSLPKALPPDILPARRFSAVLSFFSDRLTFLRRPLSWKIIHFYFPR